MIDSKDIDLAKILIYAFNYLFIGCVVVYLVSMVEEFINRVPGEPEDIEFIVFIMLVILWPLLLLVAAINFASRLRVRISKNGKVGFNIKR